MEALLRHHPGYEETGDLEEATYRKIYPGEALDGKKLGNLFYDLHERLKDWLVEQHLKADRFGRDRLYLEVLRERHLYEEYQKTVDAMLRQLEKQRETGLWTLFHRFALHFLRYYTPAESLRHAGHLFDSERELQRLFTGARYKIACEWLNRRNILNEAEMQERLQILNAPLPGTIIDQHPFVDTYRSAFNLLQTNTDRDFEAFQQLFFQNRPHLSPEDQQILLRYLLNYASARIREGQTRYYTEVLKLFLIGLDTGILIHADGLSPNIFLNVIELGTLLKGSRWAVQFIGKWENFLKEGEKESVMQLAEALVAYGRGDLKNTLLYLNQNSALDRFSKLRRYALFLRVYYDLEEEEALLSQAKAFETYLHRQSGISETILEGYRNFIRLVRQMSKYGGPGREALLERLDQTSPIYYKSWLTDRINRK